jgi:hypothetical protein
VPGSAQSRLKADTIPVLVAVEHRCQPAADAAVVDAHLLIAREDRVDVVALRFGQSFEVKLIKVAQEAGPLDVRRDGRQRPAKAFERGGLRAGEGEERLVGQQEVEDAGQAVAIVAEHLVDLLQIDICLAEQEAIRPVPGKQIAHAVEELEAVAVRRQPGPFRPDQIGRGIDAEAVHAAPQPEVHDLQDLVADIRVERVKIRLEAVEAVQVVLAGYVVVFPDTLLGAGEDWRRVGQLYRIIRPDIRVTIAG